MILAPRPIETPRPIVGTPFLCLTGGRRRTIARRRRRATPEAAGTAFALRRATVVRPRTAFEARRSPDLDFRFFNRIRGRGCRGFGRCYAFDEGR
jgi:hypothetical protein